jgi:hypothetical protein
MPPTLSVLDKLYLAHSLVAEILGQAPQLHDCHLDQALFVLSLAVKRARRSPQLRQPPVAIHPEQYPLF